ncbi:hypothetical protein FIBSPDRAFT_887714 [Athelia psychrophila]|uniref:Ribosomal protein L19e C-terminal domain-containing protein n=1 Tax=Athelia psychrophila TaxID=1759441 RepID=A0A166PG94_9AGAM|nr:hypothetical protein FIBSPDRAFT_887714 [Fibularhizoctonia sp. CBS 109695]
MFNKFNCPFDLHTSKTHAIHCVCLFYLGYGDKLNPSDRHHTGPGKPKGTNAHEGGPDEDPAGAETAAEEYREAGKIDKHMYRALYQRSKGDVFKKERMFREHIHMPRARRADRVAEKWSSITEVETTVEVTYGSPGPLCQFSIIYLASQSQAHTQQPPIIH